MTIIDSLAYLKRENEKLEKRMREEPDELAKPQLEFLMFRNFKMGCDMINAAGLGECPQKVRDYFFGKVKERPDITRLKELFAKEDKMEEEAKKSLKGKLKLWLWNLRGEILWWWIK